MNNPIIHKEVLSSLRTGKAAAMQALFLLAMAGPIVLFWPEGGLQDIAGKQAMQILSVLSIGELVMVGLFAPAFTAASLTSEKEHKTMESLFTTMMHPWEITLGKMLGCLTFLLLLVASGIPALAAPFLLGGVTGTQVVGVVGILLLTAVYLGMIGMYVSAKMHRSYRSMIVTYVLLMVIMFALAAPAWPISGGLLGRTDPILQKILHVLASLSPLQAMISLVMPGTTYDNGAMGMPPFWQLFIPLSIAVVIFTAIALFLQLRHPVAPPRPREKLKVIERGEITARSFFFIIDPRKRKRPIQWWENPVLIKEFRSRPMLQAQWLLRAIGVCLIVSVLLMFLVSVSVTALVNESGSAVPAMAAAVAGMMVVLVLLIGPSMSSGAICSDRETGVWDLLRVTRLASWRIASGKFQASIIPMLLLTLAMVPALLIMLYFNDNLLPNILRIAAVVGMTILFVCTAGTFFSSVFSRTSTATAWTYGLVAVLAVSSLLVLLAEDRFSERFVYWVFVVNPVAAALDAAGNATMQKYGLVIPHLKIMGATTAALFAVTVARVFQLRKAS